MYAVWNWGFGGEDIGLSSSAAPNSGPRRGVAVVDWVMVLYFDAGCFPIGVACTRQFLSRTRCSSASWLGSPPPGVLRAVPWGG